MREHEAGRPRMPGRWHSWLKRISNAAAHLSAASLLASGMASSLAARKRTNRHDESGGSEKADRDRNGGNDRNREDKQASDPKEDRRLDRENGDGPNKRGADRNSDREDTQELRADNSSDDSSRISKKQKADQNNDNTNNTNDGDGTSTGGNEDTTDTSGDTTEDGGVGDGGNRAGNAGSGLFDNPLATKARRRANDFENADPDRDEDGTFVDVDPNGESVYETDSVALITGPDGLEINTGNITYFAEPTPTPEPLLTLELPDREPGFPFGEDFPFGDAAISLGPAAEPSDPGDTATTTDTRAKFFPTQPEPSSDGGDNTMDFTS